ncbi:MAG: hypothetical protein JWQ19_3906, partial [Subtercola sp.]|nr:hypothetical protein [Subtercola sp.]
TRNDVPNETLTADFFRNGGWKDRHEAAHFVRNSATGLRRLSFDCARFPQTYSNKCLLPLPGPSAGTLITAKKRGPLTGLGKAKFGMSAHATAAALGGESAVMELDGGESRTILRTRTTLYGRTFNGFYNVLPSGFGLVLLKWSEFLNEDACVSEAQKIATNLSKDYGPADQFGYYEEGQKLLHYSWLFGNGATITLTNLDMKDGDCPLTLTYASKAEAE